MENNLELWDSVGTTTKDTKTKEVSYGARKFTAIDAYSQIKTATSKFGKYGEKWGFKDIEYNIIEGRIYFIGTFFYPNGNFPIFNDQKVGDDGAKKVFTDSLTKALSYLGFNADVFMGQFIGNKYTNTDKKTEYKGKFDLMDYIQRIKDETDINALDSLYKEFIKEKPTQKQKDWFVKEAGIRKDYLIDKQ